MTVLVLEGQEQHSGADTKQPLKQAHIVMGGEGAAPW